MYYVTMTDKFMSGWGMAKDKINKLVIECENYEEALIVEENAKSRSEMKYVNIRTTKPNYDKNRYFVSLTDKSDYSTWFKRGAFKK